MTIPESTVYERLDRIEDPSLDGSIVDLGLVTDVRTDPTTVHVRTAFRAPYAPEERLLEDRIRTALADLDAEVRLYADDAGRGPSDQHAAAVGNLVAVTADRRGVGTATATGNLAVALADRGARVGILDADVVGPSAARAVGVPDAPVHDAAGTLVPAETDGVKALSVDRLHDGEHPVGRRPASGRLLTTLVRDVEWRPLDYLFVCLPPGDVPASLAATVGVSGGVVVTDGADGGDAARAASAFAERGVPTLGVVETVRAFQGAEDGPEGPDDEPTVATDLPVLGTVPVDSGLRPSEGPAAAGDDAAETRAAFAALADAVTDAVGRRQRREVFMRGGPSPGPSPSEFARAVEDAGRRSGPTGVR
ncbi:P-loop NTPase [Halostella litorea]|uniref:P-loop NTPase n=1 Tax=Halostella litorea TaxID=2528831 RepID=UPI001386BD6D|nr:P-loop NTPase [Halostella litorea]